MFNKKVTNIIIIVMAVITVATVGTALFLKFQTGTIKSGRSKEEHNNLEEAREAYESGEYKSAAASYLLVLKDGDMEDGDYIQLIDSFIQLNDTKMGLNYSYIFLDKTGDTEKLKEVFYRVADCYVSEGNYKAAYELLHEAENRVAGILKAYCEEKTDVTICLAPYRDSDSEDHIYFGSYPQKGYSSDEVPEYVIKADFDENGHGIIYGKEYVRIEKKGKYTYYVYEPVRWLILADEESKLTLFADKILDCKPYTEEFRGATWDNSDLRTWMNEEFYNTCFSDSEKEYLIKHTTEQSLNYYFEFLAGEATEDYVGLMSSAELADGRYIFKNHVSEEDNQRRKTTGTDYAVAKGLFTDGKGYGEYWTCTTANVENTNTVVITENGVILMESGGEPVNKKDVGVRPFITVTE